MTTEQIITSLHGVLQMLNSIEVRRYDNIQNLAASIQCIETVKEAMIQTLRQSATEES